MAIDTYDKLIAGLAISQRHLINKASIATQATGGFTSLWRATGWPAQGAAPGAAETVTNATTGVVPITNPGGSNKLYLAGVDWVAGTTHSLLILDRLSHMGNLGGNATGDQAVSLTIPANRGIPVTGVGAIWWLEIYTDIGTTARDLTITYKDGLDADNLKTVILSIGGASPLNQDSRCFQVIPNAGQSIKEITKCSLVTGTGTAGTFGFTCSRLLAQKSLGVINVGVAYDFAQLGMPEVFANSGIFFIVQSSTTSSGVQVGTLTFAEG